ncbi:DMT family transporter [Bradyrhizobium sp. ISRA443]|uniref:DMT family transporter n=1 Tax=Bradyrhizobium sp. ISRA443 TaxID=2866198 RepID=UPI0024789AC6|nr:DMT family transporter [Bradyrhizobium sp. ISRA443]WGS11652.1 DMT family transporter [Bradyrhizobium sp. ISRA443]
MADSELKGIGYLVASSASFVALSSLIKMLAPEIPAAEIIFLRSLAALPFFSGTFIKGGSFGVLDILLSKRHFFRAIFGYLSFLCYVLCLGHLPLSDAVALSYTAPVWAFLLATVVLKEMVSLGLVATLLLGLTGTWFVVQPDLAAPDPWQAVGLAGAGMGGLAIMVVRQLSSGESPERASFGFMIWTTLIGLPLALRDWVWPRPSTLALLAVVGFLAAFVQICLTRGYALARLARGAIFDFVRLPASMVAGLLWFNEQPARSAWFGVALIIFGSAFAAAHGSVRRNSDVERAKRF